MRTLLLGLLAVANAKNVRGTRETSRDDHDKEEAIMYDWWCDTMGQGDSSIACITREMREITRRAHRNMSRITTIDDDDMKRRPEAEQQDRRDAMARAFRDQMREGRRRTHFRETSGRRRLITS
ncbi:SET domain-containing protein [Aureococcus anophagefferens]|nr:SET domain-containing protein [Aureococcus anophagefferens]KAH8071704.1 SET domain-containing protein [Aureococcus anophagefferens]